MQAKLHFIGTGLYGAKRFIRESQRIGVNRGVPWAHLSGLNYGEKILLAEYVRDDSLVETEPGKPLRKVRAQAAVIFGYFELREFSYTNMPPAVAAEYGKLLAESGLIEEVKDMGPGGVAVVRACGSYAIVSVIYLKEGKGIPEIMEVIRKACTKANEKVRCSYCNQDYETEEKALQDPDHDLGNEGKKNHKFQPTERVHYSPNSIKYFVGGRIVTLKAPIILERCEFARGLKTVNLQVAESDLEHNTNLVEYLETTQHKENALVYLKDYKLNSYVPVKERKDQGFVKTLLEEYDHSLKGVGKKK